MSLVLSACASAPSKSRQPAFQARIPFDAHVHVNYLEPNYPAEKAIQFYLQSGAEKSLLLSQGYLFDPRFLAWGGKEKRDLSDQLTSKLATAHPARFAGLCGFGYMWDGGAQALAKCLQLPAMIGAKVRMQTGDQLTMAEAQKNFLKALELNQNKLKVVLIHMPNEASGDQVNDPRAMHEDLKSLELLLTQVEKYPRTQFVLAHSLYDPRLLEHLTEKYRAGIPENLWIEASGSLSPRSNSESMEHLKASRKKIVAAWREIGIRKILFGSDISLGGKMRSNSFEKFGEIVQVEESWADAQRNFIEDSGLKQEELTLILRENSRNFLIHATFP